MCLVVGTSRHRLYCKSIGQEFAFLSEIWVKNGELSIALSKANIVATIV
jgi:hypothetical protein